MILKEEYKEYYKSKLDHETIKSYLRLIEAFCVVFNPVEATYEDLTQYFLEVKKTVATTVKCGLSSYFKFLCIKGYRVDDPTGLMDIDSGSKDVDLTALLSKQELDTILPYRENEKERYQDLKWRNLFLLSLVRYQGLSNKDLMALEIDDIIDDSEVEIGAKKRLMGNRYELVGKQVAYWMKYKAVRERIISEDTNKVFLNKRGFVLSKDGITTVFEAIKPLFPTKIIHNETLRQAVIFEKAKDTEDLRGTQKFARHKWSSTTAKYFNFLSDELKDEVEELHPFNFM